MDRRIIQPPGEEEKTLLTGWVKTDPINQECLLLRRKKFMALEHPFHRAFSVFMAFLPIIPNAENPLRSNQKLARLSEVSASLWIVLYLGEIIHKESVFSSLLEVIDVLANHVFSDLVYTINFKFVA